MRFTISLSMAAAALIALTNAAPYVNQVHGEHDDDVLKLPTRAHNPRRMPFVARSTASFTAPLFEETQAPTLNITSLGNGTFIVGMGNGTTTTLLANGTASTPTGAPRVTRKTTITVRPLPSSSVEDVRTASVAAQ